MINFEVLMLVLILSSIILIVLPSFLALLINKKNPLSPKHVSLGMIISVLTIIKFPALVMFFSDSIVKTSIISTLIYVFTETVVRYFIHRKESHQTFNNILSIGLGYISLKLVSVFLFQLYNFVQIGVIANKHPETMSELLQSLNLEILYIGQTFHSIYIVLYCLLLLMFILIEHRKVKSFYKYEAIFFIINFTAILLVTSLNYLSAYPNFYPIYYYFNLFLVVVFFIVLIFIYQYSRNVSAKRT